MRPDNCIYKTVCEDDCGTLCKRYLITKNLVELAHIPKKFRRINRLNPEPCDTQAFQTLAEIQDNIVNFVKHGESLYITSYNCGNGKTTWSIKLLLQYFNDIWDRVGFDSKGAFISVSTFLYDCKQNISTPNEEFERFKNSLFDVDLVVWDDIGTEKLSSYDYNMLLSIINQRVLDGKSNIFTGNIDPGQLHEFVGDRLASRINGGETVIFHGKDRR